MKSNFCPVCNSEAIALLKRVDGYRSKENGINMLNTGLPNMFRMKI